MLRRYLVLLTIVFSISIVGVNPAFAQDSTDELLEILQKKGVITEKDTDRLAEARKTDKYVFMQELIDLLRKKYMLSAQEHKKLTQKIDSEKTTKETAPVKSAPAVSVNVKKEDQAVLDQITQDVARQIQENVQDQVKEEIQDELQRENEIRNWEQRAPEWTRRITLTGDIRLRYQADLFDERNATFLDPSDPDEILNSTIDRYRWRIRARVGLTAMINDVTWLGFRVTTGKENDPVSTNSTLGDFFSKDDLVLDRAYIHWMPVPEFNLWAGRFENPWFYTDLVWDSDLSFEGLALNVNVETSDRTRTFYTAGAFPLQEIELNNPDKWLFGGQMGVEYRARKDIITILGIAYYDYFNTVGVVNDPSRPGETDWSAPLFQQKGNTLMDIDPSSDILTAYASDFKLLNFSAKLDFAMFYPIHVILTGDYVRNLGFDKLEVSERAGADVPEQDEGYQVGLLVGFPKVRNFLQWNASFYYKYLEADAVMDAFTDSDFHLGGTNAKGWILGGEFGVWRNLWVKIRWLSSDEIVGPRYAIDTFQFDFNARF